MRSLLGNTRKVSLICVAVAFAGVAALAIHFGRMSVRIFDTRTQITMAQSPGTFWGIVAGSLGASVIFLFLAFRAPTSHPQCNVDQIKLSPRLVIPLLVWLAVVAAFILIMGLSGNFPK